MPLRTPLTPANATLTTAAGLQSSPPGLSYPRQRHQSASMRPSTPLSPRFDGGPRPSYQRSPVSSKQQRRQFGGNLTLPGLPRFHPANFASSSQHSSLANTPGTGPGSPLAPVSPGLQQKLYTDAQRQLHTYQRETFSRSTSFTTNPAERPDGPRLQPLGSPGPVTPLELEYGENYLQAKPSSRLATSSTASLEHSEELAEKLAQAQSQRQGTANNKSSPRQSSVNVTRSR